MSLILSLGSGAIYIFYTLYGEIVIAKGSPIYSFLAESLLWFLFAVLFVVSSKFYCIEWKRFSVEGKLVKLMNGLIFPAITVILITPSSKYVIDNVTLPQIVIGIVLLIALMDIDSSIEEVVRTKFSEINDINRKLLYAVYPPKERSDLYPMDVVVFVSIIIFLIKKFT